MTPRSMRVGFQGAPGSFSEQALTGAFGGSAVTTGFETFEDVGRAISAGAAEYGFLPIENTLAGTVGATYDVIASEALTISAEVVMPIRLCLLGPRGSAWKDVGEVLSHPVALSQCRGLFRDNPGVRASAFFDTAGAAAEVARRRTSDVAAIAPRACAERYGLDIIAEGIEDRHDNQTRFVLVSRDAGAPVLDPDPGAANRAMIAATIPHVRGSLATLLTVLADGGHDLTKIEGRPGPDPWTYLYFLEMDTSEAPGWPARLRARTQADWHVRLLGIYPRLRVGGGDGDHASTLGRQGSNLQPPG